MSTIYTIGYEGTDIDRFVRTLQIIGVQVLADVRALPLSRKKGFSKNALKDRLTEAGIEYHSYQALGDPKPGRDAARAGRFDEFRKIYTAHIETEAAKEKVQELSLTASKKLPACYALNAIQRHAIAPSSPKSSLNTVSRLLIFMAMTQKYERNLVHLPSSRLEAAE